MELDKTELLDRACGEVYNKKREETLALGGSQFDMGPWPDVPSNIKFSIKEAVLPYFNAIYDIVDQAAYLRGLEEGSKELTIPEDFGKL